MKEAEWILEPLENPKNNFFDPLIKQYVKDLEIRNTFEMRQRDSFSKIMRKACPLDSVSELVEDLYTKTIGIKKQILE